MDSSHTKYNDLYNKISELNRVNSNLKSELMRYELMFKCYEKLITILDKFRDNNKDVNNDNNNNNNDNLNTNNDNNGNNINPNNDKNEEILLRQKLNSLKNFKFNNDLIVEQTLEDLKGRQLALIESTSGQILKAISSGQTPANWASHPALQAIQWTGPGRKRGPKGSQKLFRCEFLGCEEKIFKTKYHLKRHQMSLHNVGSDKSKRYVCDFVGCGLRFTDKYKLKRHQSCHSSERPFKCRYKGCGFQCKRKDNLKEHEMRHRSNSARSKLSALGELEDQQNEYNVLIPETILEEGEKQDNQNNDNNDIEMDSKEGIIDGDNMRSIAYDMNPENQNMALVPVEENKFDSSIEDNRMEFDYSVEPIDSIEKPDYQFVRLTDGFRCSFIGCMFETKHFLNFQKHYLKHLPNADQYKRFKCEFVGCGLKFFDKYKLKRHQSIHNSETPYKCERIGCDFQTKRADHLKRHEERHILRDEESILEIVEGSIAKNINPNRRFVCDYEECKKAYVHNYELTLHKKTHETRPEDLIFCGINGCQNSYNRLLHMKSLHEHQLQKHPEMFPDIEYKTCSNTDCEFKTKSAKQLTAHIKSHERYVCTYDECKKEFKDQTQFNTHMKVHKGFRFVCDLFNCEKKFLSSDSLRKHKLIHQAQRINCVWVGCDKKFFNDYDLREHLNTHTGEKPNVCPWPGCGKRFSEKQQLYCHQRTHNEINYY